MEKELLQRWIQSVCEEQTGEEEWASLGEETQELLKPLLEKMNYYKGRMYFFREALASVPNAIFVKEEDSRFNLFSRNYEEVFGMDGSGTIGKKVGELSYLPQEDRERYQREDEQMIRENSVVHYEKEFDFADGKTHETLYWSKGFEVPETGERGLIGEIVDISKEKELQRQIENHVCLLKEANEKIEKMSKTDALTGVSNRCILKQSYSDVVEYCRKTGAVFSVLMMDLDFFKRVNDEFGHITGDNVLRAFAHLAQKVYCRDEIIIRYGGEEFLVFAPRKTAEEAGKLGEEFCRQLRKIPVLPDGRNITASVGVAQYRPDETMIELLNRADETLYQAKRAGRDRVLLAEE